MIAALKGFVNRILFKNKSRKKFIAARLSPEEIIEKVFLITGKRETEITWQHCIVCHAPFLMAVWSEMQGDTNAAVQIKKNTDIRAEAELELKQSFGIDRSFVLVYEIRSVNCRQLPYWQQYILQKRYFTYKKKDTFQQGMIYGAMYSFPRRVIAVSYKDDNYFNIFPMDFQCFVENAGLIILGLRTTNTTLKKILSAGKVVISDTTNVDLQTIYDLGRNHSSAPPSLEQLPFGVTKSDLFKFYVPDFSASYKEFEIIQHLELGTHTMMIGKAGNATKLRDDRSFIHHIHFFEFAESEYTELT